MEELQSDWAREGRTKGFLTDVQAETKKLTQEKSDIVARGKMKMGSNGTELTINPADKVRFDEITKQISKLESKDFPVGKVPNNPLLKDRQEVTIKRALKEAVDNKSEYFAWIN